VHVWGDVRDARKVLLRARREDVGGDWRIILKRVSGKQVVTVWGWIEVARFC
jgi:hypothetical protein